jgi:hypothetical protein
MFHSILGFAPFGHCHVRVGMDAADNLDFALAQDRMQLHGVFGLGDPKTAVPVPNFEPFAAELDDTAFQNEIAVDVLDAGTKERDDIGKVPPITPKNMVLDNRFHGAIPFKQTSLFNSEAQILNGPHGIVPDVTPGGFRRHDLGL